MEGGTTTEIVEQGNIREDMFRLLVTAETRHRGRLHPQRECLLRARHPPRAARAARRSFCGPTSTSTRSTWPPTVTSSTTRRIQRPRPSGSSPARSGPRSSPTASTALSTRSCRASGLPDPSDAARRAAGLRGSGRARPARADTRGDLRILAYEARDFDWGSRGSADGRQGPGRAFGRSKGALETFEWLLEQREDDVEANQQLADDLPAALAELQEQRQRSDRLPRPGRHRPSSASSTPRGRPERDRAEAYALQGRNIKVRWVQSFERQAALPRPALVALRSPGLTEALQGYASAFQQDLNHFSSGVNAMALLRIRLDLAQAHPEVWLDQFDSDDEAPAASSTSARSNSSGCPAPWGCRCRRA